MQVQVQELMNLHCLRLLDLSGNACANETGEHGCPAEQSQAVAWILHIARVLCLWARCASCKDRADGCCGICELLARRNAMKSRKVSTQGAPCSK